jgi:hypothetical protein
MFLCIGPQQTLHCAACTWLNLSVAQTQCAAVIRSQQTAAMHDLNSETCQSTSTLLMVSRFTSRTCSLCQAVSKCCTNCACSNSTTASRQQQRAATEQFQPHIMQAFASTPIRMCWFSQTDLAACCILHHCVGMLHKPEYAAATTTTGRQQNTEIAATAQPELSDAAHAS